MNRTVAPRRVTCHQCEGTGKVIRYRLPVGALGHTSDMVERDCDLCQGEGERVVFVRVERGKK